MNSRSPNKKFNVNLISFGRLGFSFAKEFIGEFKNNSIISEFKIWFPENVGSELFIDQLRIITRDQMQFKPKPYRFMSDLKEIVSDSVIDPVIGNITVICSRFDYSFKSKKIKKDELIKKIIDRSYFNIQDHNGVYQKIKEKSTVTPKMRQCVKVCFQEKREAQNEQKKTQQGIEGENCP